MFREIRTIQKVEPLETSYSAAVCEGFVCQDRRRIGLNVGISATRFMNKEVVEKINSVEFGPFAVMFTINID